MRGAVYNVKGDCYTLVSLEGPSDKRCLCVGDIVTLYRVFHCTVQPGLFITASLVGFSLFPRASVFASSGM